MPIPPLPLRARAAATAAVAALALVPGTASAATVGSGALDWTSANVYDTSAPANTNRTWLGYVTGPGFLANGTATPSAGARGDAVTPASPRGADRLYTFTYGASGGAFDAQARTADVELDGTVTFNSAAHGFTSTVEDPRLVISGATGQLFASGQGQTSQGARPYDRSAPVFNLDLAGAASSVGADGTWTVTGIVPSLATADYVFGQNYAVGAGPDRTPNTFGGFGFRLAPRVQGGSGTPGGGSGDGTPGPGPQTPATTRRGTLRAAQVRRRGERTVIARLPQRPGASMTRRYAVRIVRQGRTIAAGTARNRTLRLTLRRGRHGFHRLSGTYALLPLTPGVTLSAERIRFG